MVLPKALDWLILLIILFLGFLFYIYRFRFQFWFGFVPIMQPQFSVIYQVHPSETQADDLFVYEKAQLPPVEQTVASHLLASFLEASANCQARPNWVTCIGRRGPGVGVTATSLWVTGSLRWPSRLLCCCILDIALPALSPAVRLEAYF